MPTTRLYFVSDSDSGAEMLVDATNPAQAIRHAARHFKANPASPREVARLVADGVKVEYASTAEPEPAP